MILSDGAKAFLIWGRETSRQAMPRIMRSMAQPITDPTITNSDNDVQSWHDGHRFHHGRKLHHRHFDFQLAAQPDNGVHVTILPFPIPPKFCSQLADLLFSTMRIECSPITWWPLILVLMMLLDGDTLHLLAWVILYEWQWVQCTHCREHKDPNVSPIVTMVSNFSFAFSEVTFLVMKMTMLSPNTHHFLAHKPLKQNNSKLFSMKHQPQHLLTTILYLDSATFNYPHRKLTPLPQHFR